MKKCPYCAEEIQDEAIKCRYCYSDLTVPRETALGQRPGGAAPASAPEPPTTASEPEPATTSVSEPTGTTSETPASAWGSATSTSAAGTTGAPMPSASSGDATIRYTHSGYRHVLGYGSDYFGIWDRQSPAAPVERFPRTDDGWRQAWLRFASMEPNAVEVPASGGPSTPAAAGEPDAADTAAIRYTHTGTRYLLGYGRTFFGIWDRQSPTTPVERFPRTDDGWAQAWRRYTQIEKNFAEVQS